MNIALHPKLAQFVEEQIKTGRFSTADDVVNGALAALQTQQELVGEELDKLRRKVALGVALADRGEFVECTAEDVIAEGRKVLVRRQN